jgi:mRNA interferase RelE/StbE
LVNSNRSSEKKESYRLIPTNSYLKDLRKLDRAANRRILPAIELLADSPRLGKMLRGELEGLWSLRVGEFRVIYSIEESNRTVTLRAAGHRGAIYTH